MRVSHIRYVGPVLLAAIGGLAVFLAARTPNACRQSPTPEIAARVYTTWDTREVDKYVAMWLIRRFIDPHAVFKLYPQGTYLTGPRAFDVASASWSRQHRRSTSDCIWDDLDVNDPCAERIVSVAHHVELNAWHLSAFPDAQRCFDDIERIIEETPDPNDCLERAIEYFDTVYAALKRPAARP